jgi:hypothetical protein
LVYSNIGKISDLLRNPKDKSEQLEKPGIYEIKCDRTDATLCTLHEQDAVFQSDLVNISVISDITI